MKVDFQFIYHIPEKQFELDVEPDDYEGLVTDGCSFLVWIQGLVKETKQAIQDDRSYDLVIPDIDIEVHIREYLGRAKMTMKSLRVFGEGAPLNKLRCNIFYTFSD